MLNPSKTTLHNSRESLKKVDDNLILLKNELSTYNEKVIQQIGNLVQRVSSNNSEILKSNLSLEEFQDYLEDYGRTIYCVSTQWLDGFQKELFKKFQIEISENLTQEQNLGKRSFKEMKDKKVSSSSNRLTTMKDCTIPVRKSNSSSKKKIARSQGNIIETLRNSFKSSNQKQKRRNGTVTKIQKKFKKFIGKWTLKKLVLPKNFTRDIMTCIAFDFSSSSIYLGTISSGMVRIQKPDIFTQALDREDTHIKPKEIHKISKKLKIMDVVLDKKNRIYYTSNQNKTINLIDAKSDSTIAEFSRNGEPSKQLFLSRNKEFLYIRSEDENILDEVTVKNQIEVSKKIETDMDFGGINKIEISKNLIICTFSNVNIVRIINLNEKAEEGKKDEFQVYEIKTEDVVKGASIDSKNRFLVITTFKEDRDKSRGMSGTIRYYNSISVYNIENLKNIFLVKTSKINDKKLSSFHSSYFQHVKIREIPFGTNKGKFIISACCYERPFKLIALLFDGHSIFNCTRPTVIHDKTILNFGTFFNAGFGKYWSYSSDGTINLIDFVLKN